LADDYTRIWEVNMTDNETEKCEHCDSEPVAEVVFLGWMEQTPASLCDDCVGELQECEYSGTLHEPDANMHELDDETLVCTEVRENVCSTCEWSNELCITENMLVMGDGDRVSRNHMDDTAVCYETGDRWHCDDMIYDENHGEWFHLDFAPVQSERWYRRFSHILCEKYTKYPVRNFVGIEFEAEGGDTIGQDEWTREYIAEAKDDGSLCDGTEYTTHPLRGDDIANVIDEMCERLWNNDFSLGANIGWHFHYEAQKFGRKAQKNIWTAVEKFQDAFTNTGPGWDYFNEMIRGYAEAWGSQYREWAGAWAKTQAQYPYNEHYRRYRPRRSSSPRAFVNFTPMRRNNGRRIEIRMYQPCSVLRKCKNYAALGEDYKAFIRFWDELIRKAAYRFNDLQFPDGMDEFATQFSAPTRGWLMSKIPTNTHNGE
tara:strand:- start:10678 stop:11961 length:1284 start_codon:yes stop_codon:yes gene_type:complete